MVGVVREVVADQDVEQVGVAARWAAARATSWRSRAWWRRGRPGQVARRARREQGRGDQQGGGPVLIRCWASARISARGAGSPPISRRQQWRRVVGQGAVVAPHALTVALTAG